MANDLGMRLALYRGMTTQKILDAIAECGEDFGEIGIRVEGRNPETGEPERSPRSSNNKTQTTEPKTGECKMPKTITKTDAPTLSDLCDLLNDASVEYNAAIRDGLDASDLRIDVRCDVTSLPIYGGNEPRDVQGVYSWDATHELCPEGHGDRYWVIAAREPEETDTTRPTPRA